MKNAATALLAMLALTTGSAQEQTEPSRPRGPAAATEAKTRDSAPETTATTTWIDPSRGATITRETPPTPPKACF